jgi:hypothetical protein
MAHVQQQILDAVKTLLAAAGTAATSNVFLDRVDPLQRSELPGIAIEEAPDGEAAEPYLINGVEQRTYQVDIAGAVKGGATAAADARALGLQIEKAIAASAVLAALAKGGVRITASRQVNAGDGEEIITARQQRWAFTYYVRPETPDLVV